MKTEESLPRTEGQTQAGTRDEVNPGATCPQMGMEGVWRGGEGIKVTAACLGHNHRIYVKIYP